jgi:putative ABC transport system permease protein
MLGVKAEIGRVFGVTDDRIGAGPTMLISHDLWMNYFNGDASVLGKSYMLSDEPFTVIGVMPAGFSFESRAQAWLAASRYLDPRTGTSLRSINVLARLKPHVSSDQLAGELRTLEAAANEGRSEKARTTFSVAPLRSRYVTATRSRDVIFAAIVGAILVIGCANVASLVLVRAMRHRRELAVRSALGANRGVLVRYLFVENFLLCATGLAIDRTRRRVVASANRRHRSRLPLRVVGMEYQMDLRW